MQRPPVVENLAVAVPLLGEIWAGSHFFAAHPLEPTLAFTILGILDVLACVKESLPLKTPVHITPTRCITGKLGNGQPSIRLFLPFPSAIPPPSPAWIIWLFLRILQERRKLLI